MRYFVGCRLVLACGLLVTASAAQAGIIFDVDSPSGSTVLPGQLGSVTGFVDVTAPDVGAVSTGWTATIVITAGNGATLADIILGTAIDPLPPANDIWGSMVTSNAPGGSTQTVGTFELANRALLPRTDLFSLPFTISALAPIGGTFNFDIVDAPPFATAITGLGGTFAASPEFQLTVVPEPSTMLAVGLALVAGGASRDRRRKLALATAA